MKKVVLAMLVGLAGLVALLPAVSAGGTATVGSWAVSATDGSGTWAATPTCGGSDSPDHVIVDPTAGSFISISVDQTATVDTDHMRSRITVHHDTKQRWYNLVLHGPGPARHLTTVDQALAFDLAGSAAPFESVPQIGRSARIDVTVSLQTKTGRKWRTEVTCRVALVVWADGDTDAPASAVRLPDVAHPDPHAHVAVAGLEQQFAVRKYPGGEHFPVACDGTTPHVTRELEGSIRMEPGAGSRKRHRNYPVMTSDVWVFQDFGAGRRFDWRQRSPDLPTAGIEFSQSGNPVAIRLPNGAAAHDYSPVRWTFEAHFHIRPGARDTDGLICSAAVTIR